MLLITKNIKDYFGFTFLSSKKYIISSTLFINKILYCIKEKLKFEFNKNKFFFYKKFLIYTYII
jgi:hypothetical protein